MIEIIIEGKLIFGLLTFYNVYIIMNPLVCKALYSQTHLFLLNHIKTGPCHDYVLRFKQKGVLNLFP